MDVGWRTISDESGQWEVYVRPFPSLSAKWQVSTGGGSLPAWDTHGRELFYQNGGKMMAIAVRDLSPTFATGAPRLLFEGPYVEQAFDVAPDGRFVMIQASPSEAPPTPDYSRPELVCGAGASLHRERKLLRTHDR